MQSCEKTLSAYSLRRLSGSLCESMAITICGLAAIANTMCNAPGKDGLNRAETCSGKGQWSMGMKAKPRIRLAWCVRPYLYGTALFARITGLEPDIDKIATVVLKGTTIDFVD